MLAQKIRHNTERVVICGTVGGVGCLILAAGIRLVTPIQLEDILSAGLIGVVSGMSLWISKLALGDKILLLIPLATILVPTILLPTLIGRVSILEALNFSIIGLISIIFFGYMQI